MTTHTIPAGATGWVRLRHRPRTDTRCDAVIITIGGLAAMVNNADDLRAHGRAYAEACDKLAELLAPKAAPRDVGQMSLLEGS